MEFNAEEVFVFAIELAKEAGQIIREGFDSDKRVEIKTSSIDLVTEYDKKVEAFIFAAIAKRYPSHKLIGEETTAGSESGRNDFTDYPTWILDPIDGTMNFVHTFPHVAVSIGVTYEKEAVIGVIYNPILDQMYAARKGCGATLNNNPISVSKTTELSNALIFLEIGYAKDSEKGTCVAKNFETFLSQVHGLRCTGSAALQMCLIAQGAADAYAAFSLHVWDTAAGVVIVREAGGVVIDTSGGELDLMSRRILCASTPELADKMAAQLHQYTCLPRDD